MLAQECVRRGDVTAALRAREQEIRGDPAKAGPRMFLFQLLAVTGDWERAGTHLGVVGELDGAALPMVHAYRAALRCEAERERIFSGEAPPVVLGDPDDWMARLIESLRLTAQGHHEQAGALRREAYEGAPATAGTIDGEPFAWIADGDSRLGPVLEAMVEGRYLWIPFHRLREVVIEKPADLRDLVWAVARFRFANGGQTVGLIPVRYAGSQRSADGRVQLSRLTEWEEPVAGVYLGRGQRVLITDGGEHPLLEARCISLEPPPGGEAAGNA